jgi:uncharacterized protein
MQNVTNPDNRFGDIALEMRLISSEKFNRALVVQRCILKRAKIHMPIGKVLVEMGLLSQVQVDNILEKQRVSNQVGIDPDGGSTIPNGENQDLVSIYELNLTITDDQMGAFLSPGDGRPEGVSVESVKELLASRGVVEGLVDDADLEKYLAADPLPAEPFQVAAGVPPQEGQPAKILYHFDTDPMRIGTLKEDGSMDWKDRGSIPEVKAGDLLAEKTGGSPGKAGVSVFGKEIPPPRIKEPQLKSGKGAERSEDRCQIRAKVDGTPKLAADGRVVVFTLLSFDGDIGIETGNVDFDGFIETAGAVLAGFNVTARGLRTREIQSGTVRVQEDLVSHGGIYGSTIEAGGNLKASHIHNCTLQIQGDLVVEKEIFGSTIEVNGRCFVNDGKIIASTISAKKGIEAHDIGTEAAKPCELSVGFDKKYERDAAELKRRLADLQTQKAHLQEAKNTLSAELGEITTQASRTDQELEGYTVQKRQFEEQLNGPKAVEDEEERAMLVDLVAELIEMTTNVEQRVSTLKQQDQDIRAQLAAGDSVAATVDIQIGQINEEIAVLEETAKIDPGIPVIKTTGTAYARTKIAAPHRQLLLQENMRNVRIAESKSETGKWEFNISNLR